MKNSDCCQKYSECSEKKSLGPAAHCTRKKNKNRVFIAKKSNKIQQKEIFTYFPTIGQQWWKMVKIFFGGSWRRKRHKNEKKTRKNPYDPKQVK